MLKKEMLLLNKISKEIRTVRNNVRKHALKEKDCMFIPVLASALMAINLAERGTGAAISGLENYVGAKNAERRK